LPVTVRYFAGAQAAAGMAQEQVNASTVDDLVARLTATHGAALTRVLAASTFLVDGVSVREPSYRLTDGATVDVLPPFAGG
jgi:molybdopterin converting factor small subunit